MVRNEFTFPSADGRTGIHAVEWTPDMAPRAVLVLSHGVSEHILRYEPLAAYLTKRGFAVAGHDHLGHGLSVAAPARRTWTSILRIPSAEGTPPSDSSGRCCGGSPALRSKKT